jgi:hypothetical protein
MRVRSLSVMALLAVSLAVPAGAQQLLTADAQQTVVARLMSFDQNHDGRVTGAELPERMQTLLARGDASHDEALDATEVRRLTEHPPLQVPLRGFEPGHYGFGDGGFDVDSRLHIEGAIEDLRLASATREKALRIARTVDDGAKAQARADLFAVATAVLTPEQLVDFTAAFDKDPIEPALAFSGSGNTEVARAALASVNARLRLATLTQRVVAQFSLDGNRKVELLTALEQFRAHARVNDAERAALLDKLGDLLSAQEQDDLRAALERRPIVKQDGAIAIRTRTGGADVVLVD